MTIITPTAITGITSISSSGTTLSFQNVSGGNINVSGVNISSGTNINITGVSTFTTGPVLIGSGTSTGTASQPLQVTGGAYVSGAVGVGITNPQYKLDISGGSQIIRAGGTLYLENPGTGRLGYLTTTSQGTTLSSFNGFGEPLYLIAPSSTAFISLSTAGSEKLYIDSSGRVKMPYQPAFLASGNQGNVTAAVGNYLPFNTLNTTFANSNRNSGYNTSTYLYTAPVAGLYQFYVQLYLNPNSVISSLTWWKNGTQLDYGSDAAINIFMNTNSSTTPANIMLNGSVILELSANDTVGIKPRTGNPSSISFYMGHSTFWGYLIG